MQLLNRWVESVPIWGHICQYPKRRCGLKAKDRMGGSDFLKGLSTAHDARFFVAGYCPRSWTYGVIGVLGRWVTSDLSG